MIKQMGEPQRESSVLVKYFAWICEITGKREEKVPIDGSMTLQEFIRKLLMLSVPAISTVGLALRQDPSELEQRPHLQAVGLR